MWEYLHQIESLKIELSETKRVLHNVIDMEVEKNKGLKAQLECCRKENAVLLGRVKDALGEVESALSCCESTETECVLVEIRKPLRGEHD